MTEKSPQELYEERLKRVNDAIQLKVPDRVPFFPFTHFYPAKYVGMTFEEVFYDHEKWSEANKKTILDLEPDLYTNAWIPAFTAGQAFEAVDFKQIKWPGHGVPPDHTHQFVEGEYMTADEYDALLDDPSDFALRTYMPRIYGTLQPFTMLPPLKAMLFGYAGVGMTAMLAIPEVAKALESLQKAGLEAAKRAAVMDATDAEIAALGFPAFSSAAVVVPFDVISDMLRGMRGTMLDMYRQPDKLLATMDKLLPMLIGMSLSAANMSGNPRVFIALHRGADGFLSLEQFKTFYWPGMKALILALIDAGLTPCPFFEGRYDQRLELLTELPKGKVLGLFDRTDLFRAKEIIGDTMCIAGNMPMSLLQAGTPEEVKDYARKLIDVVGKDGGYMMACSSVMDECDPALVKVWADFTKEYGMYR